MAKGRNWKKSPGAGIFGSMVKHVKEVPKGTPTLKANRLKMAASCFKKLCEIFEENPEKTEECLIGIQSGVVGGWQSSSSNAEKWPGYKRLKRIPKYWFANDLIKKSKGKISKVKMNAFEQADGELIPKIWHLVHQTSENTAITEDMQDKVVFEETFDRRNILCGERLDKLLASGVVDLPNNKLNLQKGGCFTITFLDGAAQRALHISGEGADLPSALKVNDEFKLEGNTMDKDAMLILGPTKTALIDLFSKEQRGVMQTERVINSSQDVKTISEQVVRGRKQPQSASSSIEAVDTLLEDAEKAKRKTVLDGARERLRAKKTKSKTEETVVMDANFRTPEKEKPADTEE